LQPAGAIVAAGTDGDIGLPQPWRALVARYPPDGRADAGFGSVGAVAWDGSAALPCILAVKNAPGGAGAIAAHGG